MRTTASQWNVALSIVVVVLLFYIFFLYARPRPIQSTIVIQTTPDGQVRNIGSTDTNARGVPITQSLPFNKPYVSTMSYYGAPVGSTPTSKNELNAYYTPARVGIPTDFTMDSCSCPFSKPQSTDLPLASLPTCVLLEKSSYKLSDFTGEKMT